MPRMGQLQTTSDQRARPRATFLASCWGEGCETTMSIPEVENLVNDHGASTHSLCLTDLTLPGGQGPAKLHSWPGPLRSV